MTPHKVTLYIPGIPIAQPRAKAAVIKKQVRMYTPSSRKDKDGVRVSNGSAEFKADIRRIAAEEFGTQPLLRCPVRIDWICVFPRPAAKVWKKKPMPRCPHIVRPDRDNLDKMILDSLAGIILINDWIVAAGTIAKWYAAGDEAPHTEITISWGDATEQMKLFPARTTSPTTSR